MPVIALVLAFVLTLGASSAHGSDRKPELAELSTAYAKTARPLLERYCFKCHSADRTEADIDLGVFSTLDDVRKSTRVWQKVAHMLDSAQMPPKKARQPSDDERDTMRRWVRSYLTTEAEALAGDPGRVVLRRLSNAEYTYTIRDLTGVDSLDPTREFPIDGAAGEGFTNTGDALVMSPSLVTKYLDAAKEIASHTVLLPDGIEFSPRATRRDWTDALLASIREFYGRFVTSGNDGHGTLPLEDYLAATLAERSDLTTGKTSIEAVARKRKLNARFLEALWRTLTAAPELTPSFLIDRLRERWRSAAVDDAAALAAGIAAWRTQIWTFNPIGHLGREGGPTAWMEPRDPTVTLREFSLKELVPPLATSASLYFASGDAGDGTAGDVATWGSPRLEAEGLPTIYLRDLAGLEKRIEALRRTMLSKTTHYLAAASDLHSKRARGEATPDLATLAAAHEVDTESLTIWLDYLKVRPSKAVEVSGHYTQLFSQGGNYDFISGWGSSATPSILSNSSDREVRIPGITRARKIVAHPSPTIFTAAAWRSPIEGLVRVDARIEDVHPECGNGVEWFLQHRTAADAGNLWKGEIPTRGTAVMQTKTVAVGKGELISFILGPRDGSHACDLTQIDLTISESAGNERVWDLAKDVHGRIQESNPLADGYGNKDTWHFYMIAGADVEKGNTDPLAIPPGSTLAKWQSETDPAKQTALAEAIQTLALGEIPDDRESPDALVYRQLRSLAVSLDLEALLDGVERDPRFGKHPMGHAVESRDLVVQAPSVVEFRVPADLAEGRVLRVTGRLDPEHGREGSIQLAVGKTPTEIDGLSPELPLVVTEGGNARQRIRLALDDFRALFPAAMCYTRIVPVDEVVTLTLFYRQDRHLRQLMLTGEEEAQLDRLWDRLIFVSHEPLGLISAFEQISQFATQDRPDLVIAFKPLEKRVAARAESFRKRLTAVEPVHLDAAIDFADRAWRRPLTSVEERRLRTLYRGLRDRELSHEQAIQLTLARILTSPAFLYRLETPPTGEQAAPVSNLELANRLSYFLWSSLPDNALRNLAERGELSDTQTLETETRRMLADPRTRRLAVQFACQWLGVRDFDENDEKNEALYPEFAALRGAMYEESVRFFEDMFRNDGSVLDLLEADHTFVNGALAKHYGLDGAGDDRDDWRRVEDVRAKGRGGVLAMASVLAKQSGASRTSPILRGNWIYETLLGEHLPKPPPNVPQLPESVPEGLTARQLIEKHSSVPECAKCHARIDPYGFALEAYDALGRIRPTKTDTHSKLLDGKELEGIIGLRDYLARDRRNDILRQFCRKLLGYALGRAVQLSDEPLVTEIGKRLEASGYRFSVAVEAIVISAQFREIRGRAAANEE